MGDMNALDIMSRALMVIMIAAAPPLICGLVVGIIASIFQTVTSIQEPTLAFIPKIVAVLLALMVFGSFIAATISQFTIELLDNIPK